MKKGFVIHKSCASSPARAGELLTAHGRIPTPVFCPVGSQASVKTLSPDEIKTCSAGLILANTYHLYLRPGIETIQKLGGLHSFMGWDGTILTDSGGFQVFSLSPLVKITDEGVTFKSHIDGSSHFLRPEDIIDLQQRMGADIMMSLDEVPAHDATAGKTETAVRRTSLWARRCIEAINPSSGQLFGIIQGGLNPELRQRSVREITGLGFDGYAIGGLSLGESKQDTYQTVSLTVGCLPENKPRYLMGVGSPEDLVEAVSRGIDIFDSVLPTRVSRNGGLYTRQGRINILNSQFKTQARPIEKDCSCYTCSNFSTGYLNHLFRAGEILGLRLATIHNLVFIQRLMRELRRSIIEDNLNEFRDAFLAAYRPADEFTRARQKTKWLQNRRRKTGL